MSFTNLGDAITAVGSVTPTTVTPAQINVNDLLIATCDMVIADAVTSVTDSLGNTLAAVTGANFSYNSGVSSIRTFWGISQFSGANPTVSAAFTGGGSLRLWFTRWSFTRSGVSLVSSNRGQAVAGSSPMDSGAVTLPSVGMLYGYDNYSVNATTPAGWAARSGANIQVSDNLNTAAGTYNYQPTFTGTEVWVAEIIAFVETAGAWGGLTLLGVGT